MLKGNAYKRNNRSDIMDKDFKGTKEEYVKFRKKRNEANRRYYAKPEVKIRKKKYKREYDNKNKEKISEYGYKRRARPETKERIRKWREENKEHLIEKGKEWRENNREYKRKSDREYGKRVRADPIFHKRLLKKQEEMRRNYPERIKEYNKKYHNSEKGKLKYTKHNHLRLSKKYGNEFNLNQEEIKEIFERDKVCVYCGSDNNLELDHIIPISKEGKSIFKNFVVACRSCNPSKSNKDVYVWCKLQGIEVPKIVKELLSIKD